MNVSTYNIDFSVIVVSIIQLVNLIFFLHIFLYFVGQNYSNFLLYGLLLLSVLNTIISLIVEVKL